MAERVLRELVCDAPGCEETIGVETWEIGTGGRSARVDLCPLHAAPQRDAMAWSATVRPLTRRGGGTNEARLRALIVEDDN